MKKIFRRSVNLLLVLSMLVTVMSGLCFTTHAAQATVEIVSFVGKNSDNLRSSELLEVQITGYEGNISDLTFTWDNQLGTYLYIYNSSNMYNIKDTAGEIELYGKSVNYEWDWDKFAFIEIEVPGESVSVKGYAWASVYGANLSNDSLKGSISVTVTDPKGNVIGSASYDKGFLNPSLNSDLKDTNYGVFEGETINIKDMLGRSSIVHIDCTACKVSSAETTSGNVTLVKKEDGNYYVTGNTSGVAEIKLSLRKENCKFHQNSGEQTIENKVYVFKMPNVSTTTTTLELTNLDPNCEYFIGNVKGTTSNGKVVFTGLTPDTTYEVTVRGDYEDDYAYAYVTGTTKPIFAATVNCYTDNVIADFIHYFDAEQNLFLKEASKNEYIPLNRTANGVYSADVDNGIYYVYYKNNDSYARVGDYQITIDNENNSLNIYTYSLKYNLDGGTMTSKGGVHYINSAVYATTEIPKKADSTFLYWVDQYGEQYKQGQLITAQITEPYVLTAVWESSVDVKVNITIDHSTDNDGYDHAAGKGDIDFRLMRIDATSSVPASDIISLTTNSCNGYDCVTGESETKYTSNTSNFEGKKDATYTISTTKSGYDLQSVNQTTQADGTIILDAVLEYEPNNFDLKFDVAMEDGIPTEFYPEGVNVKVSFWGLDANSQNPGWYTITQHQNTSLYIDLDDETGKGNGSYPVWNAWADKPGEPYYYRIEVVSYVLEDGRVVTNDDKAYKSDVTIVGEGKVPGYPEGADLAGSYFDGNAQVGIPTATISIESFDLTFNANGGKIKDDNKLTLNNQVVIPDLINYIPTREGGYRFAGWYKDINFTVKAESGKRLYENTTLYAKWNDPISVSGTITVDGFYYQDGKLVDVLDVDRARTVVVTLQVKNNNSYNNVVRINPEVAYNDIMSISSELAYDDETDGKITGNQDGTATVNYNFNNVPDMLSEGAEYRIRTAIINYETLYDNNGDKNFSDDEYTAIFDGNNADVDAHLKFSADEFVQNYEIDATLIGEGYRPQNGLTQILFQTTGTNPPNTVISQHNVEPYGENFTFGNNGVAKGSLKLWKGISNGAISNYQLKVTKIDGNEYDESLPFSIRYGATTSWNTASGTAGTLKATLVPKEYVVNLDINTTDEVGGMDNYKKTDGTGYFTTHKWSYDTPIAATPTREGFVFVGWEAEEEGIYAEQKVQASVAKEITLKAVWAEFEWVTDTDSGYFETNEGKSAVVRFLFDVETTDKLRADIEKTGIKFIKSTKIEDNLVGDLSKGNSTTFYGDIKNIPESNAGTKYYAIAYIICNGRTYWSLPIEREPAFDDLITYKNEE